jgi:CRISPR/Cas system-associated protein Csm6
VLLSSFLSTTSTTQGKISNGTRMILERLETNLTVKWEIQSIKVIEAYDELFETVRTQYESIKDSIVIRLE